MSTDLAILPFTRAHHREVVALWSRTEGITLRAMDSEEAIAAYLERNPGCSFVALRGDRLVGAALCGHDGRRGYLHHLAVEVAERRDGIGRRAGGMS